MTQWRNDTMGGGTRRDAGVLVGSQTGLKQVPTGPYQVPNRSQTGDQKYKIQIRIKTSLILMATRITRGLHED